MCKVERKRPQDVYINRVKSARQRLPKRWLDLFLQKHPEYDNKKGVTLLRSVTALRTSCVRITELMESLADELESKKVA